VPRIPLIAVASRPRRRLSMLLPCHPPNTKTQDQPCLSTFLPSVFLTLVESLSALIRQCPQCPIFQSCRRRRLMCSEAPAQQSHASKGLSGGSYTVIKKGNKTLNNGPFSCSCPWSVATKCRPSSHLSTRCSPCIPFATCAPSSRSIPTAPTLPVR
jgi:hypothetical protein